MHVQCLAVLFTFVFILSSYLLNKISGDGDFLLFVIISRRFSCKLGKFNEKPLKWFSLKKIKHLLRIYT